MHAVKGMARRKHLADAGLRAMSDSLCSKQFWRELWADIRKSWKCAVFGHPVNYKVITTGGAKFIRLDDCKLCGCKFKNL